MALDEADLKKIAELLDGKIGALKVDEIRQGLTALDGKIGAATGEIEKIKAAPPKVETAPAGGKVAKKDDPAIDPALATRLETLEAQARQAEERAQKAEADARARQLDTALTDALGKAGIKPDLINHARAFIMQGGAVRYDDKTGAHVMDGEIAGVKQPIPLADGIAKWAKSDDAKPYLPPVNPNGGTGQNGAVRPGPAPQGSGTLNSLADVLAAAGLG